MTQTREMTRLAYSVGELCAVSGARKTSVYAAIKRGDLQTVRISPQGPKGKLLITAESVHKWLTPQPRPEPEQP